MQYKARTKVKLDKMAEKIKLTIYYLTVFDNDDIVKIVS